MIQFNCPHCNHVIGVPDDSAGKKGACKNCGHAIQVPVVQGFAQKSFASTTPELFPVMIDRDDEVSRGRKYLIGIFILVVVALLLSQSFPKPSSWLGWILLILSLSMFIPQIQKIPRRWLRREEGNDWRTKLKLGLLAFMGIVLISASQIGSSRIAEAVRLAEEKAAEEAARNAELQRLTKKANERVAAMVKTAEIYWQYKNMAKVEETLDSASNISHATNLHPIQKLRTRIADTQVKELVLEATSFIKESNVEKAREIVATALAIPHAKNVSYAQKLGNQIQLATDSKHNRAILMELSDKQFQSLQKSGEMPKEFISGYQELDTRIANLTKAHVEEIVAERKKREQERMERERLAAIAAKKAMEERKAREAAEAIVKLKNTRKKKIAAGFSSWDGSHRELTKLIKESMNDPSSYEHAKTVYWENRDHLIVQATFRGKNAFGALVLSRVKAKVDLNGNVIEVLEQEP